MRAGSTILAKLVVAPLAVGAMALAGCETQAKRDAERDPRVYQSVLATPATRPTIGDALSLDEAVALANYANESLAIEGESLVRAMLDRRRAVADFLPSVTGSASYNIRERVAGSSGGGIVSGGGTGTGGSVVVGGGDDDGSSSNGSDYDADFNVPIDARWVLFDGLRNVNAYWRNVYLVERERENLLEVQETLLFDVANVYYTVLAAQERVRVLENSVTVQEERLRDIRGRQEAGVARPLDIAQTEAQFAATRVQLIEARREVADGRSLLAYLLNDSSVEAMPFDDGYAPQPAGPVARLLAHARTHRSELAAATRAVQAAERDVRVAIGAYYPSVTLDLTAFVHRESAPTARDWESLLELSFPIFSGGRLDADTRAAWSFLREANLIEQQSIRRVRREVEQAYRDLLASRERLNELDVQLRAAAESFRQAEAVYQAGRGTNLERVTAQDAQLQAELALVSEAINEKLLNLSLARAAGLLRETLLDPRGEMTRPATLPATVPAAS